MHLNSLIDAINNLRKYNFGKNLRLLFQWRINNNVWLYLSDKLFDLLFQSLEQLGIGNTFTQYANFSGFTGKNEVFFNSVIHEAKIEVDEEGATVVAATGEMAGFSPKIPSQSFVCDRPFAYIIYDYIGSKMLFMGTYSEPKTE